MTAIAKTRKGTAQRYAELLAAALPKPIETEAENERALEIVNHLMSKGQKKLAPEKRWLLRMLVPEEPGRGVEDGERKGSRPTSSAHRWNQTVFSQWGPAAGPSLVFGCYVNFNLHQCPQLRASYGRKALAGVEFAQSR